MQSALRKSFRPAFSLAGLLALGAVFSGCDSEETADPDADKLVVLTSPQGGETFKVGDTIRITWKTPRVDPELPVDPVDIHFSPDSGKIWRPLTDQSIPKGSIVEWEPLKWVVPETLSYSGLKIPLVGSTKCLIRVKNYEIQDASQQQDILDKTFSIIAKNP